MRNKMNIDMIMYNLSYSLPVTLYWFVMTFIYIGEKMRNKIDIDVIKFKLTDFLSHYNDLLWQSDIWKKMTNIDLIVHNL